MALPIPHRTFTVDEYYRMADAGVFGPEERTELIDGEIIVMTPPGERHASMVDRLTMFLARTTGPEVIVRVQNPLRLGIKNEPQPDVTVLRYRDDYYASGHPGPGDALVVVEVADSSLPFDRGYKRKMYASAGVREFWLVDAKRGAVTVCSDPDGGDYTEEQEYRRGETWTSAALGGRPIRTADVVGPGPAA